MGTLITFYSYKGGVGRSMMLANVATMMCKWGYKVLIIDWDLEAPGIEKFFLSQFSVIERYEAEELKMKQGLIDLLLSKTNKKSSLDWRNLIINIPFDELGKIDLITSGRKDTTYFTNVRNFDLSDFYENQDGGYWLEELRSEWLEYYDFVLIDSRTGVTDSGGICTIQLPDILVMVFTATWQSLEGVVDVGKSINISRQNLPIQRPKVPIFPIPSRFDTQTEFKTSQYWLDEFVSYLHPFYSQWLPTKIADFNKVRELIELIKVPYIPYFSFGEKLPVLEQGTTDPSGLGYSYENIAAFLVNKLANVDDFFTAREEYVNQVDIKNKKVKLYLSYSWANEDLIREFMFNFSISHSYELLNAKIFDIQPGINWRNMQQQFIEESDLVVCFITKQYIESNAVLAELQYASHKNKLMIPIYFDSLSSKSFKFNNDIVHSLEVRGNIYFDGRVNFRKINQFVDAVIRNEIVNIEDSKIDRLIKRKFWETNWDSMYHNKSGCPKNQKEALEWIRLTAEQGDLESQLFLGDWYKSKHFLVKHIDSAKKWYLLACEQKSPVAYFKMGQIHEDENNFEGAMKYYQFASYYGFTEAQTAINKIQRNEKT